MTLEEAIAQVDLLKPNSYSEDEKRTWLLRLEDRIKIEIIDTHVAPAPKYTLGDVDGDGKITEADADLVRSSLGRPADVRVLNEEQEKAADVDGDGDVTAIDANIIRKYALGIIDTFPAGDPVFELYAESPYDEVYLRFLEAQIDYANGEIERYNNSIAAFNHAYSAFERFYNRTHLPLGCRRKYF